MALHYSLCPASAEELETKTYTHFINADKEKGLETSVIFYAKKDKPTIILVNAVHSGDRGYYADLSIVLENSRLILHEGITFRKKENPLEILDIPKQTYNLARDIVGFYSKEMDLTSQQIMMQTRKDNWIGCDFTEKEFLKKRFEKSSGLSVLRDLQNILCNEVYVPFLSLSKGIEYSQLSGDERAIEFRKFFIKEFKKELIKDPKQEKDETYSLVIERNYMPLYALDYFLGKHPDLPTISLFYGASHGPNLDLEIRKRGYDQKASLWLTAWTTDPDKFDNRNHGTPYLDYEVQEILKDLSL